MISVLVLMPMRMPTKAPPVAVLRPPRSRSSTSLLPISLLRPFLTRFVPLCVFFVTSDCSICVFVCVLQKSYMAYIKAYMGRVKKHLEENNAARVAPFQAAAQNFVKKVLTKFDDYKL